MKILNQSLRNKSDDEEILNLKRCAYYLGYSKFEGSKAKFKTAGLSTSAYDKPWRYTFDEECCFEGKLSPQPAVGAKQGEVSPRVQTEVEVQK